MTTQVSARNDQCEPISMRLVAIVDRWLASRDPGDLRDALEDERARLQQPLKLAVAGRISCGKSTLVNALLGERLAPTGPSDTTRIVTRYSRGQTESAELILSDGARRQIVLAVDGSLPEHIPADIDDVAAIDVRVPYGDVLSELTIIDTPGISRVGEEARGIGRAALLRGELDVDALVFLFGRGGTDEVDAINEFETQLGSLGDGIRLIGVLSRIDERGGDEDPIQAAAPLARAIEQAPALRGRLTSVIPINGLVAETARTGALRRRDYDELARVATSDDVDWLLLSTDLFVEGPSRPARERLLGMLGMHGVKLALAAINAGARSPDELADALLHGSGLTLLEHEMRTQLLSHRDVIKADRAVSTLERLVFAAPPAEQGDMRAALESALAEPEMRRIHEFRLLRQSVSDEVELPDWLESAISSALVGSGPRGRLGLSDSVSGRDAVVAATALARRTQDYAANGLRSSGQQRASMVLLKSLGSIRHSLEEEMRHELA